MAQTVGTSEAREVLGGMLRKALDHPIMETDRNGDDRCFHFSHSLL